MPLRRAAGSRRAAAARRRRRGALHAVAAGLAPAPLLHPPSRRSPSSDAELARARSSAFANWNAVFFAFFPERRRGDLTIEKDGAIVLRREGGIDRRVSLDPHSSLPKTMTHQEGARTVTVDFVVYETVDGLQVEKEIHRTNGDPRFDAVIRFTKTVFDPPIEASLFTVAPEAAAPAPTPSPSSPWHRQ